MTRFLTLPVGLMPALALALAGCAKNLCDDTRALAGEAKVLAVGDSVLAWNIGDCQSIPDHVAFALGAPVSNRAISGARVLSASKNSPAIVDQYQPGGWDWVIIDGGGNDLNDACPGDGCAARHDALVSADGSTGALPVLIARIRADGARVIVLGYYPVHKDAWYDFNEIPQEIEEHDARLAKLAADGVLFFDLGELVTPERTPEAYTFDNVHPTPAATAPLGARIAELLRAASRE